MRVEPELRLDFDDVLIRPKRSVAPSRASVDLKREYRFRTGAPHGKWTGIPIIAANLDTTGTMQMAVAPSRLARIPGSRADPRKPGNPVINTALIFSLPLGCRRSMGAPRLTQVCALGAMLPEHALRVM